MPKRYVTWHEIDSWSRWALNDLQEQIEECERVHLIAIARGGWIPARLIAGLLEANGLKVTYDSVSASSYEGEVQGELMVDDSFEIPDTDVVVIVDDLVDTGETMEALVRIAQGKTNCEVLTCVLIEKDCTTFTPSSRGIVLEGGTWVVFPFELEDLHESQQGD